MVALLSLLLFASTPADSTESDTHLVRQTVTAYVAPHDSTLDVDLWRVAWADVNEDGLQDAIVFIADPEWCGTGGCTLLVLEAVPEFEREELGDYFVAAEIERVNAPVRLSGQRSTGWCDLLVQSEAGHPVRLRFDGETYPFSSADGTASGDEPGTVLFAAAD